jgi:hypothetical protein
MENCKRSREQQAGRACPSAHTKIPEHIVIQLNTLTERFVEYIVPELDSGVLESLEAGKLTPDCIYEQVLESSARGNKPEQIVAVHTFLMNHYRAIVRGEHPVPLGSIYRRVPFS